MKTQKNPKASRGETNKQKKLASNLKVTQLFTLLRTLIISLQKVCLVMNKLTLITLPSSTCLSFLDYVSCQLWQSHNDSLALVASCKSITFHCRHPPVTTALQLYLNPPNQDEYKGSSRIPSPPPPPFIPFFFCSSFFTTKFTILLEERYRLLLKISKTFKSDRRLSSLIVCPCNIDCAEC